MHGVGVMVDEQENDTTGSEWMQGAELEEWTKRVRARKRSSGFKKKRHKRKRRPDERWL